MGLVMVVVLEAVTEVRSLNHCVSMERIVLEVVVVVVLDALRRLGMLAEAVLAHQMASLSPCLTREGTHH